MIDSRLQAIYDDKAELDPEYQRLLDQFAASLGPSGLDALLDGTCTLIYLYMKWLRLACEAHDQDVIETVVPTLVGTMRKMPQTFRPEVIPIMAGLLISSGLGLSPSLWRAQYGRWTDAEMNPLEGTAVLLAEHINRISNDRDFATRMVTDALTGADKE